MVGSNENTITLVFAASLVRGKSEKTGLPQT